MQLLDVRYIRRPSRFLRSRLGGQVVLNPTDTVHNHLPILGSFCAPIPCDNLVFDNNDDLIHPDHSNVLKTISVFESRHNGTMFVERYYTINHKSPSVGSLFRVRYSQQRASSFQNFRVLTYLPNNHFADPHTQFMLGAARHFVSPEAFADLYLDAVTWTRVCETWFSAWPMLGNVHYISQILTSLCQQQLTSTEWEHKIITAMHSSPNYKPIPVEDYVTQQQALGTKINLNDIFSYFRSSLIDPSPCLSLYPDQLDQEHCNNLTLFGRSIELVMGYRLTDFSVTAHFAAQAIDEIGHVEVHYLVDRKAPFDNQSSTIIELHGGFRPVDLAEIHKEFCKARNIIAHPHAIRLTITRTYDEEVTFLFQDDSGVINELFYFDLNVCTLISPDVCINRINFSSTYPRLERETREVSLWV